MDFEIFLKGLFRHRILEQFQGIAFWIGYIAKGKGSGDLNLDEDFLRKWNY